MEEATEKVCILHFIICAKILNMGSDIILPAFMISGTAGLTNLASSQEAEWKFWASKHTWSFL